MSLVSAIWQKRSHSKRSEASSRNCSRLKGLAVGNPAGATYTFYDDHGRVAQTRMRWVHGDSDLDAVTDFAYDSLDRVVTQTAPEPNWECPFFGRGVTTTTYDNLGRVIEVEHPNEFVTSTSYAPTGEVIETDGFGVNPVRYEYDDLGRLWKLKTYQNPSGPGSWTGEAITTWNYSSTRGTLTSKSYNSGGGPSYLYTAAGRVSRKTNQRSIQANYTFNNLGEVTFINYSDTTQDVTLSYDRLGRLKTVKDAAGERTFVYDDAGRMLTETIATATGAGNLLSGVTVTNAYDPTTRLRTSHTTAKSTLSRTVNYGYDAERRMDHVQKGALHARYEYHPVSGQVSKVTYIHDDDDPAGRPVVSGERRFDRLGRLTSLEWASGGVSNAGAIAGFGYEHDEMGRRVRMNLTVDETFWEYSYDERNQLSIANHQKDNGVSIVTIPGEVHAYIYDAMGNRYAVFEGGGDGQSSYLASYTTNLLNQYTARDIPGHVEVIGRSSLSSVNDVKVNNVSAWLQSGIYAKRVTFNNSAAPVVADIQVKEFISSTIHRTSWWDVFLPKDPESFSYDADGNLTLDGVWHYTWDAENRLTSMQMRDEVASVILNGSGQTLDPWVRIEFAYDWMGRRIMKLFQTSTDDPATHGGKYGPPIIWKNTRSTRYVYDGWHLSMSYKTTGSSLEDQSFAWGPDLSSSYGGAGGIGGLVAYSDDEHDALNPAPSDPDFLGPMFPIYDGNGNVVKMIRFESLGGSPEVFEARESASYEYGPFGENRSTTGEFGAPAAGGTHQGQRNPFRFSTRYTDAETGLVYYGYRYYSANLGRWISRDPKQEVDINVYSAMRNAPTLFVDFLGLQTSPLTSNGYQYGYDDTPNSRPLDTSAYNSLSGGIGYLGLADIHFRAWLTVQGGYTRGYDDAANLLRHFLQGSGSTYQIGFTRMNRDDNGAKIWRRTEINRAMAAAEVLAIPNSSITMRTIRERVANPGATSAEWVYAINGYRTWAKATVTQIDCQNYEMHMSFRMRDNYDWDPRGWLKAGLVYDYEMAILNGYGWAREFEVEGREDILIQWKKGQRYNTGTVTPVSRPNPRTRDRTWDERSFPLG